jgi:hypothetical protein
MPAPLTYWQMAGLWMMGETWQPSQLQLDLGL